ncbi:MAG: DUF192 domain-containing protein [Minisyncoccia bacterium]
MTKIKFVLLAVLLIFLIYIVPYFFATQPDYGKLKVFVGGKEFIVRVADTKDEREKGLSGTPSLPLGEGMLFVFSGSNNYGFWMKDMQYPIDIVWIGEDLKITHIEKSLSPDTYPKVYYPLKPSRYVLEVSSGQSDNLKVKIGDSVIFSRE